jgi:hypothetical protein
MRGFCSKEKVIDICVYEDALTGGCSEDIYAGISGGGGKS